MPTLRIFHRGVLGDRDSSKGAESVWRLLTGMFPSRNECCTQEMMPRCDSSVLQGRQHGSLKRQPGQPPRYS